jgi:Cupin domain
MQERRRQVIVGSIERHETERGWFFGHFMDEPLLRSDLVEVAWQRVPNRAPSSDQRHLHEQSVEINVVLNGTVELKINDIDHICHRGDFYVVWPGTVVSDIRTDADAEVLVIRAPSIPNDKIQLNSQSPTKAP